jgi:hypothetical protein
VRLIRIERKRALKPDVRQIGLPILLYLLISWCFVFIFSVPSSAFMTSAGEEFEEVNVEESIEFTSSSKSHDLIKFDIFEDIARAKDLLERRQCGFKVKVIKSKKGRKSELGEFSILLAIENLKTRDIRVIRVHPRLGANSEGIVVEPGKSNGVNTKFTIVYPEHHIVLAIRRPVRHGTTFKEVVYSPYSEGLDIPAVREEGLEYLKNVLREAKNDLTKRGVRPLSCDTFVSNETSVALAIIEHIDPLKFESGQYTAEKLIHETLVILGTNKRSAYRFSASKAGARGLFQFIPDTYKRIVRLYPQAGLDKDFIRGMEDHKNAAKASLLLFDADLRIVNNGKKEQLMDEPQALGRFLASAYNCGSGKTRGAMDRHGENWHSNVPAETQIYLKKFDAVWEWLNLQPQTTLSSYVGDGNKL